MGIINNPLPSSLASECTKCGKILTSFIDPKQAFGPDKVIPPEILANAKGLAILTVIKGGFIGSFRTGSGLVIARLPNGGWSAPSAIMTAGVGLGTQVGLEITDFVFILNDRHAVKTFSQQGSITLGGNVGVAAGPVGRNAEAAGVASLKSVSGVFAYSKTKGLFAGISLEGSAIIERREANEKLYGQPLTAQQLLSGAVRPPDQSTNLMTVLNSRVFAGTAQGYYPGNDMYNDIPVYNETNPNYDPNPNPGYNPSAYNNQNNNDFARPNRSWSDDLYDNDGGYGGGVGRSNTIGSRRNNGEDYMNPGVRKAPPPRPTGTKPGAGMQARAKFTFKAAQAGDLGFSKGDIISEIKMTDGSPVRVTSGEDTWWMGKVGGSTGTFPSNYVEVMR